MTKKGDTFHRTVHAIERTIVGRAGVQVDISKYLIDKDTGELREHDIVVTDTRSHHDIVVAIECRDRQRPVGVPDVEQFRAKCLATGIHRGIIVSSHGFAQTALRKAREMDIGCLALLDVESFDWCQMLGIDFDSLHLKRVDAMVMLSRDIKERPKTFLVKDFEGNNVDDRLKNRAARAALRELDIVLQPGEDIGVCFESANVRWRLFDERGSELPVTSVRFVLQLDFVSDFISFDFLQYIDSVNDKNVRKVALAYVDRPSIKGRFMLVRDDKGETEVVFVRDPEGKNDSDLIDMEVRLTIEQFQTQ